MSKKTRAISAVGVAVVASTVLAACGGGSSDNSGSTGGSTGGSNASSSKGGTLYYLYQKSIDHLDPQRTYTGVDMANIGRLWSRSLVQFPTTEDPKKAATPVPDLATGTGKMSDGGKTWKFTLKDGVKWQDGKPVTCEDVKYGVSRTFATDVITGGPNYKLKYFDIPTVKSGKRKGLPVYDGPYKNDGKKYYDKAVQCNGKTITFHFKKPWPDFNLAVAELRSFDPYRKDKDQGNKSNYAVFSDGPYKLQGTWTKGKGGTFVRNPEYDKKTDPVRKALPDKIVFQAGVDQDVIGKRMIADSGNDKNAVTYLNLPPSLFSQITGPVAQRAVNPQSPFTNYLVPNFRKLANKPKVLQALLWATNKSGYIQAGGGSKMYAPAYSVVNPAVLGYTKNPIFAKVPDKGDPAKAKKLLKEAGVKLPYKITLAYPGGTTTADKQFSALKQTYDKAGFKVTLKSLPDTYYSNIQNPNFKADLIWGGWGADWPAMSTVIPPLFDSRVNLTPSSTGQDYGSYKSDEVNKLIDQAGSQTSADAAAKIYAKIDKKLAEDVAYIPLVVQKFYWLHGSNVTGYINNPAVAMYPDLGAIGVKQ